ncbi:MAG: hypothetical protein ACJAWZ_004154, partial [Paracoccaceae bacterium]
GAPPAAATLRAMLAAAGDPQAAMAALAADAPAPDPLFATAPAPAPAPAPASAPEAPMFAPNPKPQAEEPPMFPVTEDEAPLFAPSAPPASEEPPLFPETAPETGGGAIQSPHFADEQATLEAMEPAAHVQASQGLVPEAHEAEERDAADHDPGPEDNVFAAAYRDLAAEKSTSGDANRVLHDDDRTSASAPSEGAPHDRGERP